MLAYACCIFLRAEMNGIPSVTLIQAKSRVASKKITLPRLELLATVIGVRLCEMVESIDKFKFMETFYCSNSMVVLAWIKQKNTFVENRVKELKFSSEMSEWHHLPI
ncbi:hypothetical protein JTB14_007853 [Gonioctena quinquepunctata]|nr:hypothetical protein JTB14_007853 [Gonioctena quinquepunctata]